MSNVDYHEKMCSAIAHFIKIIEDCPGWREWKRDHIGYLLAGDMRDSLYGGGGISKEFRFPDNIEMQHKLISHYINLYKSLSSLKHVEFYFRRYPFNDLPITHHDHVVYVCEMYFSRIYEFRGRLKRYLNVIDGVIVGKKVDVGGFLKLFDREFKQELKERNRIHHHEEFEDIDTSHLFITGILPEDKAWGREQKRIYRRVTKEWAERVQQRSKVVEEFLNVVAQLSLENCDFLRDMSK